mmetsp:Transcript_92033/g.159682  ORF Transcript_92033/g.159682 Transcript_92033/m.159682 type:complete len:264 (-) Transcript_92033:946-1737(-)
MAGAGPAVPGTCADSERTGTECAAVDTALPGVTARLPAEDTGAATGDCLALALASATTASASSWASWLAPAWLPMRAVRSDRLRFISSRKPSNFERSVGVLPKQLLVSELFKGLVLDTCEVCGGGDDPRAGSNLADISGEPFDELIVGVAICAALSRRGEPAVEPALEPPVLSRAGSGSLSCGEPCSADRCSEASARSPPAHAGVRFPLPPAAAVPAVAPLACRLRSICLVTRCRFASLAAVSWLSSKKFMEMSAPPPVTQTS